MPNSAIVVTMRLTPSDAPAFQRFLAEILPDTCKASGCRSVKTYVGKDSSSDFLLIQEWDSAENQQTYMAWRESTGVLQTFLGHLAKPADVSAWTLDPA